MNIEVYGPDNLKEGAAIARKYRLFQNNWCLSGLYSYIHNGWSGYDVLRIFIARVDGVPVASAVVQGPYQPQEFQVFVRGKHRRKGIGSALYKRAMREMERTTPLIMGVDHSSKAEAFYDKNRVRNFDIITEDEEVATITEAVKETV